MKTPVRPQSMLMNKMHLTHSKMVSNINTFGTLIIEGVQLSTRSKIEEQIKLSNHPPTTIKCSKATILTTTATILHPRYHRGRALVECSTEITIRTEEWITQPRISMPIFPQRRNMQGSTRSHRFRLQNTKVWEPRMGTLSFKTPVDMDGIPSKRFM